MGSSHSSLLCQRQESQLLIIDIQERLSAAMPDGFRTEVVNRSNILLQGAELLSVPVVTSEQYPRGLGPTLPELKIPHTSARLEKRCFSCTAATGFHAAMAAGRKQVVIAGMETHICVLQTAFGLLQAGFSVFVVEDAVCSRTQANKQNALRRMAAAGISITNSESVLFEWLGDAGQPEFKSISALIR